MIIALILSIFIDFILSIIIFVCSLNIESILSIKKNDESTNELIQNLIDKHSINVSFSLANFIIFIVLDIIFIIYLCHKKYKDCKKENIFIFHLNYQKYKDCFKNIFNKIKLCRNKGNEENRIQNVNNYKNSETDLNKKNEYNRIKIDFNNNIPLNSEDIPINKVNIKNKILNEKNSNNHLENEKSVDENIVVKEEKKNTIYKSKTFGSSITDISFEEKNNDNMPAKQPKKKYL